jgi:hypothetical protein
MNDREFELFEAQLRRLKPSRPPEQFLTRMVDAQTVLPAPRKALSQPNRWADAWWWRLRWLAPVATTAVVVVLLLGRQSRVVDPPQSKSAIAPVQPALGADNVEIDRQLVAAYDAVAKMPTGESVRFRCQEWMDQVVLRDSVRGIVIEQRTPHFEAVPVNYDTY